MAAIYPYWNNGTRGNSPECLKGEKRETDTLFVWLSCEKVYGYVRKIGDWINGRNMGGKYMGEKSNYSLQTSSEKENEIIVYVA